MKKIILILLSQVFLFNIDASAKAPKINNIYAKYIIIKLQTGKK